MSYAKMLSLALLLTALATAGCGNKGGTSTTDKGSASTGSSKEGDHVHGNGPNGGVTFGLGKYHAELTVDHPKKEITVLILKEVKGKKEKDWPEEPVDATDFTLVTKETKVKEGADSGKAVPAMTIKLLPRGAADGKAARFVGTDPGLANVADFEGTVFGKIDGKESNGKFKE